jgi:hypothetical protein
VLLLFVHVGLASVSWIGSVIVSVVVKELSDDDQALKTSNQSDMSNRVADIVGPEYGAQRLTPRTAKNIMKQYEATAT